MLAAAGSFCAVALLPAAIFQIVLYRQNLAAAREVFPLAAPLLKSDRVLVISPHCDDETLGAGGTMASAHQVGAVTRVVFITNGDGSGSTRLVQQAQEFRSEIGQEIQNLTRRATGLAVLPTRDGSNRKTAAPQNLFQRIAAMRQGEALAACKVLGVKKNDVIFLGYPDGGTRAMWETNWLPNQPYFSATTKTRQSPYKNSFTPRASYCGSQVVSDLQRIIREFRPTRIITTHPEDTHPDHWAAYAYTVAALENLRLSPNASSRVVAARAKLSAFLVHHGSWPVPHAYAPNAELAPPASLENSGTRWRLEPLSIANRNAKKSALECYVSQLVFTPLYLRSFIRKNELFGQVPATNLNSSLVRRSSRLLKDAPSDSLWRERWPAADIRALEVQNAANGVLVLRADLGRAPSSRVRYRFALHALDGLSTRAFEIEASSQTGKLIAKLLPHNETQQGDKGEYSQIKLAGKINACGFELYLPMRALLPFPKRAAMLLISASANAGATRLDQTATATLHLNSPLTKPLRALNGAH